MGKSARVLQSCNPKKGKCAFPQPSELETELEQRRQCVILVPSRSQLYSTHSQQKVVISREARDQLATRRETTAIERMGGGYGDYVMKL